MNFLHTAWYYSFYLLWIKRDPKEKEIIALETFQSGECKVTCQRSVSIWPEVIYVKILFFPKTNSQFKSTVIQKTSSKNRNTLFLNEKFIECFAIYLKHSPSSILYNKYKNNSIPGLAIVLNSLEFLSYPCLAMCET